MGQQKFILKHQFEVCETIELTCDNEVIDVPTPTNEPKSWRHFFRVLAFLAIFLKPVKLIVDSLK